MLVTSELIMPDVLELYSLFTGTFTVDKNVFASLSVQLRKVSFDLFFKYTIKFFLMSFSLYDISCCVLVFHQV